MKFGFTKNENKKLYPSFNDLVAQSSGLSLDKLGIVQFILFLYPLYQRTFVNDIKFRATWGDGTDMKLDYNESRTGYSRANEYKLWDIIENAIDSISRDTNKVYGVGNSGGLDSRVILYLLRRQGKKIASYTLGDPKSDAFYIADRVSRKLEITNKHVHIENDFLMKYWKFVIQNRPMHSLVYSWYYSGYQTLPRFDLHITGFNGDNMLGSHLGKEIREISKRKELFRYIYLHYLTVPESLLSPILLDKSLIWKAYDDFKKNISKSQNTNNENIFEEFNFICRQLRFIRESINFDYCNEIEWKSPFFNREFIDFCLNLTFEERYNRRLYYSAAKSNMPEFKKIRFERSPLTVSESALSRKIKNMLWKIDTSRNFKIYYKGGHKNIGDWLRKSNSFNFIRDVFNRKSNLFNEIFDIKFITSNLNSLYQKNLYLVFNLLTTKIWIERYLEN